MSSLCDRCYAPGACCKRITLTEHDEEAGTSAEITVWDDDETETVPGKCDEFGRPFPFRKLKKRETFTDEETGDTYSTWYWTCPILQPDGRCGDYENRPETCRVFEPASDRLCVHYQGAEAGDPSAPLVSEE